MYFLMCSPVKTCEIWQDGNADDRTIKEIKDVKSLNRPETLTFCVLVLYACHYNILFDRVILDWINV